MKRLKFEDLLRDSISRYGALSLHLGKCNSSFSIQMLLDNVRLTSISCDFGTWYFTKKDGLDLPSLKNVEAPYIKVFVLYKKLEEQFNTKLSKLDTFKKRIPFIKSNPDPIQELISDLHINTLLLVNALRKIEAEFLSYKVSLSPLYQPSSIISKKIKSNLALINKDLALADTKFISTKLNAGLTIKSNHQKINDTIVNIYDTSPIAPGIKGAILEAKSKNESSELNLPNKGINSSIKDVLNTRLVETVKSEREYSNFGFSNKQNGSDSSKSTSRTVQWESLLAMKKLMDDLG